MNIAGQVPGSAAGETPPVGAKQFRSGTHRAVAPAVTLERWLPAAPRFGITRLANVTGLDTIGIPVYVAVRPNSRALAVSQGKGLTKAAAKASALMESIETWHAERLRLPCIFESFAALRAEGRAADATGLTLNTGADLDPHLPIAFVEGKDLISGERRWVPHEAVTANFVLPRGVRPTFLMSTNGLASGNLFSEACVHGICEVIERDAITLWEHLSPALQRSRQLDLATVDDAYCQQLLHRLAAAGVDLAAWDITSDIGVPCFAVTLFETGDAGGGRAVGMFSGYGCHLDHAVALSRAITEAVQSRLTMISGSRDDLFYADYRHNRNPDDVRNFAAWVREKPPTLRFPTKPGPVGVTFEDDLDLLARRLAVAGLRELVVVDLTREEFGIPVVKVLVPGLAGPFRSSVPAARLAAGAAR